MMSVMIKLQIHCTNVLFHRFVQVTTIQYNEIQCTTEFGTSCKMDYVSIQGAADCTSYILIKNKLKPVASINQNTSHK